MKNTTPWLKYNAAVAQNTIRVSILGSGDKYTHTHTATFCPVCCTLIMAVVAVVHCFCPRIAVCSSSIISAKSRSRRRGGEEEVCHHSHIFLLFLSFFLRASLIDTMHPRRRVCDRQSDQLPGKTLSPTLCTLSLSFSVDSTKQESVSAAGQ